VHWRAALAVALGAIAGGQVGAWLMMRVNETALRVAVVGIGMALTIGLFFKAFA
jgi:uncharacterized membrane protein YfcA